MNVHSLVQSRNKIAIVQLTRKFGFPEPPG